MVPEGRVPNRISPLLISGHLPSTLFPFELKRTRFSVLSFRFQLSALFEGSVIDDQSADESMEA